jgi:hypothetical protein
MRLVMIVRNSRSRNIITAKAAVELPFLDEPVGLCHQQLRPAERIPARHEVGEVEQVERDHEAVDRVRDHRRPKERQRYRLELLPGRRAVHLGRLVQVGRNALQGTGRNDRVERPSEPCVGGQQGEVGQRQRNERNRILDLVDPVDLEEVGWQPEQNSDSAEEHVHGAVVGIEDAPPDGRDDDRWNDHRQDEQRAIHALEFQVCVVQEERDRHPQDDVNGDVRERPPQVEEQQPEELEVRDAELVLDDVGVVVETDRIRRDLAAQVLQPVVRERHPGLE